MPPVPTLVQRVLDLGTNVATQLKATNAAVAARAVRANNLSDLADAAAARANIGLIRSSGNWSTGVLANGAEADLSIGLSATYHILAILTDRPARVRLYQTAAQRAADAGRAIGTDPAGDAGVCMDYVTADGNLHTLSPFADGFNNDYPVSAIAYARVTNLGANGAVSVALAWLGVG